MENDLLASDLDQFVFVEGTHSERANLNHWICDKSLTKVNEQQAMSERKIVKSVTTSKAL